MVSLGHRRFTLLFFGLMFAVAGSLMIGPTLARAECTERNKKKIKKYTRAAKDDFDMMEFDSALRKLKRALEYGMDNDCEESIEYAGALLQRGILHLRGQKDRTRGSNYMRKAIKANSCVKIDPNEPPVVQRLWKKVRQDLSRYRCKGGGGTPGRRPPPRRRDPDPDPDPPRRRRHVVPRVNYGDPPTKACEHITVEEVIAGNPVRMLVKVKKGIPAGKVIVFYKPQGSAKFISLKLRKSAVGWAWVGLIPSVNVYGRRISYFIEVQSDEGKAICAPIRGASSMNPEIIMVKPGERRTASGCAEELPEEICEDNPDHPCCKKPRRGGGRDPDRDPDRRKPDRVKDPLKYPPFYINVGFALGLGYLGTGMTTFLANPQNQLVHESPHNAGFALGSVGGSAEFGYFVAAKHLLSVNFRMGYTPSERSTTAVLGWAALAKYRFYVLGAGKTDLFSLYVGGALGYGQTYHSLTVGSNPAQKASFAHKGVILGALVGVQIGSQKVGWFVEADASAIFPTQATFQLTITTGVTFRL